jgi:hypothetical protein
MTYIFGFMYKRDLITEYSVNALAIARYSSPILKNYIEERKRRHEITFTVPILEFHMDYGALGIKTSII